MPTFLISQADAQKLGLGPIQKGWVTINGHHVFIGDDDSETVAKKMYQRASEAEPGITKAVTESVQQNGGQMEGLDFRLKSEESLGRKIDIEATQRGLSPREAQDYITDSVRYTAIFKPDNLVQGVNSTSDLLRQQGFELYDHHYTNYFGSGGPYQGYNTAWINPSTGQKFELQFHTEESFRIKQSNHVLYEKYRATTNPAEREILAHSMVRAWSGFTMPVNYASLP
jgi:hypothetical protein